MEGEIPRQGPTKEEIQGRWWERRARKISKKRTPMKQ
jgi:hypothetical protein